MRSPYTLAGGALSLVAGAVLAYVFKDKKTPNSDKKIQIRVVGERNSGKSTLIDYLRNAELNSDIPQTSDKVGVKPIKYKNVTFEFKSDLPGDRNHEDERIESVKEADVIIYMINAQELSEEKNSKSLFRPKYYLEFTSNAQNKNKDNKLFILYVTHRDKIEQEYMDKIIIYCRQLKKIAGDKVNFKYKHHPLTSESLDKHNLREELFEEIIHEV